MVAYDPHDWRSHLFDWRGSLIREIMPRLSLCAAWAIVATMFLRGGGTWLAEIVPIRLGGINLWKFSAEALTLPITLHNLSGFALGLLLVFRTNSSYDRFWEGRKLWGGIVNETRNLSRAACVHLARDPALRNEVVRWTIAFAYATMHHLRGIASLGPVATRLDRVQAEAAKSSRHVPWETARRLTSLLRRGLEGGHYGEVVFQSLDANVQLLVDYLGACERIHKTPLPYAYVVHLRRVVILYLATLPFALVREFGWATPLATTAMAFVFFGIEEIGVEIEDPFEGAENDIPLEEICTAIDRQLSDHIGDTTPRENSDS